MDVSSDSRRAAFRAAIGEVRSWVAEGAWDRPGVEHADPLMAEVKPQVIVE